MKKEPTKIELLNKIEMLEAELNKRGHEHIYQLATEAEKAQLSERERLRAIKKFKAITQAQIVNLRAASWVTEMIETAGTHFIKREMCASFRAMLDKREADMYAMYHLMDKSEKDTEDEHPF